MLMILIYCYTLCQWPKHFILQPSAPTLFFYSLPWSTSVRPLPIPTRLGGAISRQLLYRRMPDFILVFLKKKYFCFFNSVNILMFWDHSIWIFWGWCVKLRCLVFWKPWLCTTDTHTRVPHTVKSLFNNTVDKIHLPTNHVYIFFKHDYFI